MRKAVVFAGVVSALGVAVQPASAAYVRASVRWVAQPPPATFEPQPVRDVIYDGEGNEPNSITVAADPSRTGVVITDPGTPMHGELPGAGVQATWFCSTPGTSVAVCAATPGDDCHALYCDHIPGPATFNGLLKIAGNNSSDDITILPTLYESRVWGVLGDDVIDVANGAKDVVDCGPGVDRVSADAGDTVLSNCENVIR
jgi:hypothetical protein